MLKFSDLQKRAEQLPQRIGRLKKSKPLFACVVHGQAELKGRNVLDDALIISKLAISLSTVNHSHFLRGFIYEITHHHDELTKKEFDELKTKILAGCYLFKWQYNKNNDTYDSLIKLIKGDLNINDLSALSPERLNSCLDEFSKYCTFVYDNKKIPLYLELNKLLGDDIQLEIYGVRHPSDATYSMIPGFLRTIGINYEG